MPRLAALRVPALRDLAGQFRLLPAKAALRQLEQVEAMAPEIDPGVAYPAEWVLFRITGYRADRADAGDGQPVVIPGAALLADLSALAERLSEAAGLGEGSLDGALTIEALMERWRVSRKTIERLRREGLVARRVAVARGLHRLAFAPGTVAWFEARHAERLRGAGGFERAPAETVARIVRRAARYRARLGWSLNRAAERLAERFGRSHEGVRQMLIRHDEALVAAGREAVFDRPPPLRGGRRRSVAEAALGGERVAALAERTKRSPRGVYAALTRERAERLRGLDLAGPESPVFSREDAAGVLLSPEAVRVGLGAPGPGTLAALLEAARRAEPTIGAVEASRAVAYWFLRWRAARLIEGLSRHHPRAAAVDEIETALRWAARLKAELVRSQLPLVARNAEDALGRAMTALPASAARSLATATLDALVEGVERFDPFKGGRLAAPAGLAVSRAIARWAQGEGSASLRAAPGQAAPRADPAGVVLEDVTRRVCPWQAWLEADPRVVAGLGGLPVEARALLEARYGLGDGPPRTVAELARELGVPVAVVSRRERAAVRACLESEAIEP